MPESFFTINLGEGNEMPVLKKKKETVDRERAKQQVELAKAKGIEETEKFKVAYDAFLKATEDLVLYSETMKELRISVDNLQKTVLEPILFGQSIYGMPEHIYNDIRLGIFKSLIAQYDKRPE